MAKLSSDKLTDFVKSAGINYMPADQLFYKKFLYKVELNLTTPGVGSSGRVGCNIGINDTLARVKLNAFVEKTIERIQIIEDRRTILNWIDQLPDVDFKRRMGKESCDLYFCDPSVVIALLQEFPERIVSVTGPLSDEHATLLEDHDKIIMREHLYFGKYRYKLIVDDSADFFDECGCTLRDWLKKIGADRHRASRLESQFEKYLAGMRMQPLARRKESTIDGITVYFAEKRDFFYAKLLTASYVRESDYLVLFDELK